MGTIQDSINSIIGTAAVGVAGYKKLKGDAAAAELTKAANLDKAIELESGLAEQENAISELDKKIEVVGKDNPELGTPEEAGILASEEASGEAELPNSLTMAKKALGNLEKQREAKIALRDLTQKRIKSLRGGAE